MSNIVNVARACFRILLVVVLLLPCCAYFSADAASARPILLKRDPKYAVLPTHGSNAQVSQSQPRSHQARHKKQVGFLNGARGSAAMSPLIYMDVSVATPRDQPPILAIGTGDNGDFFSNNGGVTWLEPERSNCADCDNWYSDVLNPSWMMTINRTNMSRFNTRPWALDSYRTNPSNLTRLVNFSLNDATTTLRPVVQTLPSEVPRMDAVWIECCADVGSNTGRPALIRTSDINNPSADQVVTYLPQGSWGVQTSGGHTSTSFFIWNIQDNSVNKYTGGAWTRLVPGTGARIADRFFVNPYDPNEIYMVESQAGTDPGGNLFRPALLLINRRGDSFFMTVRPRQ